MKTQLIERQKQILNLKQEEFDCLIIGGGATGSGSALEATRRGLKTALVERFDFAQGTSSRSTKLLHGGVRYLELAFKQLDLGQLNLVKDALSERKNVIEMAPHLAKPMPLIIPLYQFWQMPYYFAGLFLYDLLSGKQSLGKSKVLSLKKTLELFPSLNTEGMIGSVMYYDGQFDDARLNVEVAMLAIDNGASIANYIEVVDIIKENGICRGAKVKDALTNDEFVIKSKVVINATGPYTDSIRKMDAQEANKILKVSSGAHIVIDKSFAPGDGALLIPKTEDGRVIFIVPWREFTLVGTTDEAAEVTDNPQATEADIEYLLKYANLYLEDSVTRQDVLSAWSGLRPLVSPAHADSTAKLSRDHTIITSASKLITITGGKWTTFRKMAKDAVNEVMKQLSKPTSPALPVTPVAGGQDYNLEKLNSSLSETIEAEDIKKHLIDYYGSRSLVIQEIMKDKGIERLDSKYPFTTAEVIYTCRYEMVINADDVLSRRFRLSFIDANTSQKVKAKVLQLVTEERKSFDLVS